MKETNRTNFPRVLIVSHNPFSLVHNNGKTFASFFRGWLKENMAQLYLTTDVPDFTTFENYFQLHDVDIVKRFFLGNKIQGRKVTVADASEMASFKSKVKSSLIMKILRKSVSPIFQVVKDILWNVAGYKTSELEAFVDGYNPQVIFFHSYKEVFAFDLVQWICKKKAIPLIMFITDDYVSGKFSLDPFFWLQYFRVRKAYQQAIALSDCIVAGGEKMAKEFKLSFGGKYIVAMNAIPELNLPARTTGDGTVQFLYAGNLGLNRWKVLALIAECLKELHSEEGIQAVLSIYSLSELGANELSQLNIPPFSSFKGPLNTEQLNKAKADSDVLVHVESFDKKNKHITRLSVSTKIPEYLASRRCIFAVGPEDVASIQYLVDHDLGVTVTAESKQEIKAALNKLIDNRELRTRYADKGVIFAKEQHSADKTAENIYQIVTEAVNK